MAMTKMPLSARERGIFVMAMAKHKTTEAPINWPPLSDANVFVIDHASPGLGFNETTGASRRN
jgi:hypothetical protein